MPLPNDQAEITDVSVERRLQTLRRIPVVSLAADPSAGQVG